MYTISRFFWNLLLQIYGYLSAISKALQVTALVKPTVDLSITTSTKLDISDCSGSAVELFV